MKYTFLKILLLITLSATSFANSHHPATYKTYHFKTLAKKIMAQLNHEKMATKDQDYALYAYTTKEDKFYVDINQYLRVKKDQFSFDEHYEWFSVDPVEAEKITQDLTSYISVQPHLPEDLILFRGLETQFIPEPAPLTEGYEYIDYGFLSTTTDYQVALRFLKPQMNQKYKAIYVMYLTSNTKKGLLVDAYESEVLLAPKQKVKIMAHKNIQAINYYLVQLCTQVCEKTARSKAVEFFLKFDP